MLNCYYYLQQVNDCAHYLPIVSQLQDHLLCCVGMLSWSVQSVFHRFPCWKLLASVLFLLMEGTNAD